MHQLSLPLRLDEYNGWTNYQTWNVVLWVDNDYAAYWARYHRREKLWTATNVERFVRRIWPGGTPDLVNDGGFAGVNWQEIADHWNEEDT